MKPLTDTEKSILFPFVLAICIAGTLFAWVWSCIQCLLETPWVVVKTMKLLYGDKNAA